MIDKIVHFRKYDVTRYLVGNEGMTITYNSVEDEVGNINSFEPTESAYYSGGGTGTFRVKLNKEKYFLSLVLDNFKETNSTLDAAYVQFPVVITYYDRKTKEIVATEVLKGAKCIREGGQEQETKKNTQYLTYNYKFADNFTDYSGRYVYTDETTYTGEGIKLSQQVSKPEDVFVVYVKNTMERALPQDYDVAVSEDGCTLTFNGNNQELKEGDKVVITYLTTSTEIL